MMCCPICESDRCACEKCGKCHGEGVVEYDKYTEGYAPMAVQVVCGYCDGTGEIMEDNCGRRN